MDMRPYFPDIFRNSALFYFLRRKYAHFDSVLFGCIISSQDRTNLFVAIFYSCGIAVKFLKLLQMLELGNLNFVLHLLRRAYFHNISQSSLAIFFLRKNHTSFDFVFLQASACYLNRTNLFLTIVLDYSITSRFTRSSQFLKLSNLNFHFHLLPSLDNCRIII